jgi:hypothetical protein
LILFIQCIRIINEFIANYQVSDDVSPTSNFSKYTENNVILETPQKPTKKILFETPDPSHQSLSRLKDTGLFLSPATANFHESIEKAMKLSEVVYNSRNLKEVRKNIIQSIDHILNHNLCCEHPAAANFVGMAERNMQEIKEEFNKVILSIFGSNIGKDNEVCFPSYKKKKKTQVEKQYKGIAG